MSKIEDGGPAFAYGNHDQGGAEGMSLRDWFAGQVDGLSEDASPSYCEHLVGRPMPEGIGRSAFQWWAEADAAFRYMKADAMLAARKGGDT